MDRACFQNLSSKTRCTSNIIRTFYLSAITSICVMFFLSIATLWAESNPNERYPMLSLTPEEASWLEAQSRIEIGIMNGWPPFDFVSADGRPRGIGVDFIHALNKRLKNKLVIKPGVWSDIYNQVKEKKLAALMDITPKESREPFFNFTRPYLSVPHVIIAPKEMPFIGSETDLKGKILALEKGFGNVTYFQTHYPDIQIKEYADTKTALDAVARKEADAYAGNRAVALYLMEEEVMLNLKVHGPLKKEGSILAMGIRKDWPILRDILQKALDNLSREERRKIIGKWTLARAESSPLSPSLTAEEKRWLTAHPVIRVSSEPDYAPFDYQTNGQPTGYSIDYIRLVARHLNIQLEFIKDTWGNLLEKAEKREVDLLHSIFKTPAERESYLNFTKPYKQTLDAIVTPRDTTGIHVLDDIKELHLALVRGDSAAGLVLQQMPDLNATMMNTYEEALKAVAYGQADATITELPVANYLMRKLLLSNLKIAAELKDIKGRDTDYRLAVRKDWPLLISILEKAMDTIQPEELTALDNRWFSLIQRSKTEPQPPKNSFISGAAFQIAVIALIFFLISWIIIRQIGRSHTDPLSSAFATGGARRLILLLNTLLVAITIALAWWAMDRVKSKIQEGAQKTLDTTLQSTMTAMGLWSKGQLNRLEQLASDPAVIQLVSKHENNRTRIDAFFQFTSAFSTARQPDHLGVDIITPEGIILFSTAEYRMGREHEILKHRPERLTRLLLGESVLVPPLPSDISFQSATNNSGRPAPPTLFFAVPVRDNRDKIIAVLAHALDPHGTFSEITLRGKMGKTEKTYLFDREGQLLTQSRFLNQLQRAGLINKGDQSILSIRILDPGKVLFQNIGQTVETDQRPLTRMAADAVKGHSGADLNGYRDYRGVKVVGVWTWNHGLDLGVASEMDAEEAFEVYRTVQWLALPILALVVLLTLAFTIFILVIGERANLALMASRDALEERVEERTRALKKLTRATEQSPVSVIITDKEGTIEYVNPTFTRVTGYTFEEAVGKNPRILKSDQHEPEFYQSLWDTILSGNTWTGDIVNLKKNREAFWEQVSIAPLVNENGEITNFVAMKEDISDKKKLLQELMEAKDAAEKANQAKSIFLANMSHEIRTPMNAILGYSQLMQHDERLSQENLKHLDIINRSGDHLLKLINDILEMSKIEAGRIELTPVTFDLHDVILDLELMFRQRADEKELDFSINRSPDLPRFIFGDENKIRQVLVNLMGNAVKFTRNGEIRLTVKAEADDDHLIHEASKQLVLDNLIVTLAPQRPCRDGNGQSEGEQDGQNDAVGERGQDNGSQGVLIRDEGLTLEDDLERESPEKEGSPPGSATDEIHLIFEVMDTGPGVPENHHELIFGAFEQSDSGRQAHGGTGLGLAISRKYARMMSGDITIRNRPGFGAVFKFDCRVRQAEPLTRDDDGFEFHSVLHLKDEIPPQKILVVDDRIFNVDLLSKMLLRVGFEVRQAYNGKEAVALFETWQPNAVLMDVRMPVMDGIEATRRIRAYERRLRQKRSDGDTRQSAAIIAVSASSLEYQKKEILQKGLADDFIGKPFKEMEIYKTLEKYLNVTYTYKNRQYANKKDASLNPDNAIATQTVENSLKNDLKENAEQYGDKLTQLDGLQRAFRALPESLSSRLQEAIINLEIDHIRDLTEQIESADKTLASTILKLIESYDFDTLNTISGAKE